MNNAANLNGKQVLFTDEIACRKVHEALEAGAGFPKQDESKLDPVWGDMFLTGTTARTRKKSVPKAIDEYIQKLPDEERSRPIMGVVKAFRKARAEAPAERAEILDSEDEADVYAQAYEVMKRDPDIYKKGDLLVRAIQVENDLPDPDGDDDQPQPRGVMRPNGSWVIAPIPNPVLRMSVSRLIRWKRK